VLDAPLIEGLLGDLQLMADLLGRHPLVDETVIANSWPIVGVLDTDLVLFRMDFVQ